MGVDSVMFARASRALVLLLAVGACAAEPAESVVYDCAFNYSCDDDLDVSFATLEGEDVDDIQVQADAWTAACSRAAQVQVRNDRCDQVLCLALCEPQVEP